MSKIQKLFDGKLRVINMGLASFAAPLQDKETPVVQMDWNPPASGKPEILALLDRLKAFSEKGNAQ